MPIDSLFGASQPSIPAIDLGMNDAALMRVDTVYIRGGMYGEGFVTQDESGADVNRFKWLFVLTDENGSPLTDAESGNLLVVDVLTGLQFFAKAKNLSKQVRIMKALLTADEFAAWADGRPAPGLRDLIGRPVQVDVGLNDNGYPTASSVLGPRRSQKGLAEPGRLTTAE